MDLATLTKSMTFVALIVTMLATGLGVRWTEVLAAAKQVRLVLLALSANFLFVPAATVGLLWWFHPEPMIAAGFLILAACPGAPVGPLFASIAKADVPAAIGLMVILAGLSAILSPILLATLLRFFCSQNELQVHYLSIVQTLIATQLLPLAIGMAMHAYSPQQTARIVKPFHALANLLLVAVTALIVVTQWEMLVSIRTRGWFGMMLLLAASLAIGWICGGPRETTRATLAVTTGVRNAAVGLVIVANNFASTAAATALVAYALVSIFGTLGWALLYNAWKSAKGSSTRSTMPTSTANLRG
ncbi:MAG: Pantothenate precursors transporter PanS [Planctomycetota bacterium]